MTHGSSVLFRGGGWWQAMTTTDQINLVDQDVYEHHGPPHEQFAWLREHAPVFWHENGGAPGFPGFWAVTSHDGVMQVSRHPEIFSSAQRSTAFRELPDNVVERRRLMIIDMDPPRHTRQRGLVNRGFTPRMIGRLEDSIRQLCISLLDGVAQRGEADFVADVAAPLPVHVICELTAAEFNLFILLLVLGGNETTRNAASGGMLAFFEHPQQWQRLVASPALIPTAAEELIRWVSPINLFRRTAICDTELGGQQIAAGDKVVVFYSSANGDEAVFTSPREFDIGREPNPHLAFGFGPHFCLGRHLAALELRILLQAIAERMPEITLDGPVTRLRSNFINGIKHMPVRFPPAGGSG